MRVFLDEVVAWAGEQRDVRLAVLLGSQARAATPADELSDVDVVLFVDDPARFLGDAAWLERFGEPLLTFVEPTAVGEFRERRVLFREGLEVDFAVLPAAVAEDPPAEALPVFARGFRVLYGDGSALEALELPVVEPEVPTQAQFDHVVNDFWYHLLWGAKKLRRGELLLAKQVCDCFLTGKVVDLARWSSHHEDTWHGLRFFEQWANAEIVASIGSTFADYDPADVERGLRAKGELFGKLSDEVSERFGLTSSVDRRAVLRRFDELISAA